MVYSPEDVGLAAEAGRLSVAIRFQVCLVHAPESGHQLLEVARRHVQRIRREDAGTLRLVCKELAL